MLEIIMNLYIMGIKKDFFNSLKKDIEDKLIKNESFEILKRYNNKNYVVLFFL